MIELHWSVKTDQHQEAVRIYFVRLETLEIARVTSVPIQWVRQLV